jgi:polyisoprenoid-binding protein YceI
MPQDQPMVFFFDSRKSFISVQVFAAGIASVVAHSPKFTVRQFIGKVEFFPGATRKVSVGVNMPVRSLEITDDIGKMERSEIERVMFEEVLEADKYPEIEFSSPRVQAAQPGESLQKLRGNLSLHGVTRELSLELQVVVTEGALRAQGSFSLKQTDFGLKLGSIANGKLKFKNELKCACFIIGRRV